ncbi:Similar to Fucose-specific lectin; acc. no. P18891 [Pyronema omphalodes CBS 100304]|uniref:Similar to Fucose-specific lectin acc. no. P18891 n=1 Tax=Pyronema omphalodes (strain CBS 100304) TaxID=1076935 RepID=U4LRZ3_PYROM|nr:Similar to Fucose-specific lectin; acc. no. P18891 [Pyronema omphalodes CBS 100304]
MGPILNRTPLAACAFSDGNGAHIRVYYQDTEGTVKETYYDDKAGWALRNPDVIGKAKLNTGIACCAWANGTQIRVYFIDANNKICERIYEGGAAGSWHDGTLSISHDFKAAPYSKLSCIGYDQYESLRVYYQDTSNKLRELIFDGSKWKEGDNSLPTACSGSAISANAHKERQDRWIYYQDVSMNPKEIWYDGSRWNNGGFNPTGVFSPCAGIKTAMWNNSGNSEIRNVSVSDDNMLRVTTYTGKAWTGTKDLTRTITGSDVACVIVPGTNHWTRVYYQAEGEKIAEYGSNDGQNWSLMQASLPTSN